MKRLRRRFAFLLGRRRFESELEEEMQFHLEMLAAEEGEYGARRRFGSAARLKEESRDAWGWGPLERLALDLKYALRTLRHNPAFTAVAVLTLALAIGANTAVFSIVNAVVLRPLPFEDPGRLAMLWEKWDKRGEDRVVVAPYNFAAWKQQSRSFESMAAITGRGAILTFDGEPAEIPGAAVTRDFFEVLGVRPVRGRTFLPAEYRPKTRVAVLGEGLAERLGAAAGKSVVVNREPHLVVGIMARGFSFPDEAQVWTPAPDPDPADSGNHYLRVFGRLKRGVSFAAARSEMAALAARLRQAQPAHNPVTGLTIVPLQEQIVGEKRRALLVLFAAVGCVLLIACANVANLMLARANGRRREVALRLAVGASRWRVVRGLLVESLLIAFTAGAIGLAWAWSAVRAFVALDPLELPRLQEVAVDASLLLFTLAVAAATGILFGLAPALRISRPDLNEALKEGSERQAFAGPGRNRALGALAVAQLAFAIVLLVAAGLLVRSFVKRITVPLGFQPERLLAIELPWSARTRIDEALERIRALPGARYAAVATSYPHQPANFSGGFSIQGDARTGLEAGNILVTPDYFRTAGMALRRGRAFTEADRADAAAVVVVNEALVRQYFGGRDPIGTQVRTTDGKTWRTVVGVVADVKGFGVDGEPQPVVYIPYRQAYWGNPVYVIVRTAVPPASLASAVRREIRQMSPRWVIEISSVQELLSEMVAVPRFYAVLVAAFAGLAFLLAAVGVYALINYSVAQRTHEIGVRMALGAGRSEVMQMIVGRAFVLLLAGTAVGLAGAWASTRALESLLFQVRARDAASFAAASALLAAAGLLAAWLPAQRATRIDPTVALRS